VETWSESWRSVLLKLESFRKNQLRLGGGSRLGWVGGWVEGVGVGIESGWYLGICNKAVQLSQERLHAFREPDMVGLSSIVLQAEFKDLRVSGRWHPGPGTQWSPGSGACANASWTPA
jgi:hypothetical protein